MEETGRRWRRDTISRFLSQVREETIMNQRVAKRIRKRIYGPDGSIRAREYVIDEKTGQIINLGMRRMYQDAKKVYKDKS